MVASSIFQSRVRWTRLTAFQPGELSGPSHRAFYLFRGRINPLLHDVRKNMHNSLKIRYIHIWQCWMDLKSLTTTSLPHRTYQSPLAPNLRLTNNHFHD
jgi:hypothetical protein